MNITLHSPMRKEGDEAMQGTLKDKQILIVPSFCSSVCYLPICHACLV